MNCECKYQYLISLFSYFHWKGRGVSIHNKKKDYGLYSVIIGCNRPDML